MSVKITPQLIDYLLYNLPSLKDQAADIHPRQTPVYAVLYQRGRKGGSSQVESVAINRATITLVLDAVERAVKHLPPDCRKIYRMKYRAGMRHWQIARKAYLGERTVQRKVEIIRDAVCQRLQGLPGIVVGDMLARKWHENGTK